MTNTVGAVQSILLLGGTSEIGLVITAEFLKKGPAKVILASLPNDPLREASAGKMKAAGASEVVTFGFDATDFGSHSGVIGKAFTDGDVDICITAFGMPSDAEELQQNRRKAVLAANISYADTVSMGVLVGQKFKAQDHGQLIVISSVAGERMCRSNFIYGSTKAGLDGFYLSPGKALEEYGVKTLTIRPGQVHTHMPADVGGTPPTVNKEDVAKLTVKSVEAGKTLVQALPAFQLVIMVLKHISRPIFRKLPIQERVPKGSMKLGGA